MRGRAGARGRGPKPSHRIRLDAKEYATLRRLARRRTAPHAEVMRAKLLLLAYEHPEWSNAAIAQAVGCTDRTVRTWRARARDGPRLGDAPRPGKPRFFSSVQRAQVTALACTLPRDSGRPLSRWSSTEVVATVRARGIAATISASTIRRWLRAERIKPWQYHSWPHPTDPRFLERAIPVLDRYERAQE